MADHDPMCPHITQRPSPQECEDLLPCLCRLIAHVRADEREQVGRVWAKREDLLLGDIEVARADERAALNGKLLTLYLQLGDMLNDYNHAEAVAARLVEVICSDEIVIRHLRDLKKQREAERNAARADADHWHAQLLARATELHTALVERDAARAEAIRYSDEIDRMVGELSAIRMEHEAEVAALREEVAHAWAVANGEARR